MNCEIEFLPVDPGPKAGDAILLAQLVVVRQAAATNGKRLVTTVFARKAAKLGQTAAK